MEYTFSKIEMPELGQWDSFLKTFLKRKRAFLSGLQTFEVLAEGKVVTQLFVSFEVASTTKIELYLKWPDRTNRSTEQIVDVFDAFMGMFRLPSECTVEIWLLDIPDAAYHTLCRNMQQVGFTSSDTYIIDGAAKADHSEDYMVFFTYTGVPQKNKWTGRLLRVLLLVWSWGRQKLVA